MSTTTNVDAEGLKKDCEIALLKIECARWREWNELVDRHTGDKRRKVFGVFTVGTNYTKEEAEKYLKENDGMYSSPHDSIFNRWWKGVERIEKVEALCERALNEQDGDDIVTLDKEDWDVIKHWKEKDYE